MSPRTKSVAIGVAALLAGHALWRHQQVTGLRGHLRRLERAAAHDPLTGLLNREGLLRNLNRLLAADRPVWVLLADLDQFKLINDGFGHDIGDQVIVEVAHRLRTVTRPGWQIGRLHGDEFAGCGLGDLDTGLAAATAIRRAVSLQPMRIGGISLAPVQISVGVAVHRVGLSGALLLKHADLAMYEAKDTAGGVVAYRTNGADTSHLPVRPRLRDRGRPRHA